MLGLIGLFTWTWIGDFALTKASGINTSSSQEEFAEYNNPRLIWLTHEERQCLQKMDTLKYIKVFREVQAMADEVLDAQPSPTDSIYYEGLVSNDPRRLATVKHLADMRQLYDLTWGYLLTAEEKYAFQAIRYLKAWVTTYRPTGNDVNENKLDICFYTFDLLRDYIGRSDRLVIEGWLREIAKLQMARWSLTQGSSNRHVKRLKLILTAGIVLNEQKYVDFASGQFDALIDGAFYEDGTSRDLERRDALHYHMDCVAAFLELAFLTRQVGVGLYARSGRNGGSVKKSLHYVFPYIKGDKVHPEWVHSKVGLDRRRWETGDPYYRPGKPWDPQEAYPGLVMASAFDKQVRSLLEFLPPGFQDDQHTKRLWLAVKCLQFSD